MAKKKKATEPRVCEFVKFTHRTIHRREIAGAPYNPRLIQNVSRDKLKKNLKQRGLLNALVWNEVTGNLVSGHQRLAILDSLMRTEDYLIPVDVVNLTLEQEKEQNVFFNNRDAQGDWDEDALRELIAESTFDSEAAGFDLSEVVERFGEETLVAAPDKLQALSEALEAAKARNETIKKTTGGENNTDFYRVVVFANAEDAEKLSAFNEEFGCVFLHGKRLLERMGADA